MPIFIIHHGILYSIFTLPKCIYHYISEEFLVFHEQKSVWQGTIPRGGSFISTFHVSNSLMQAKISNEKFKCYNIFFPCEIKSNSIDLKMSRNYNLPPLSPSNLGLDWRTAVCQKWPFLMSEMTISHFWESILLLSYFFGMK